MGSLLKSTDNTRAILPDSLRFLRSDVPWRISEEEVSWLMAQRIRTVIDLREASERDRKPCPLAVYPGFRYLCMPVTGGGTVPPSPDQVSLSYMAMADSPMEDIVSTILSADTNVLYFCNAGKDRTGVVSALLLHRLGFDREYIIADYLESADNLKETLHAYALRNPEMDETVITPQRRYMEEFLDWLTKKNTA